MNPCHLSSQALLLNKGKEPRCGGWIDILKEITDAMLRDYPAQKVMHTTGPLMISRSLPDRYMNPCHLSSQALLLNKGKE